MRWLVLLTVLTGCKFAPGQGTSSGTGDAAPPDDAGVPDAPDAMVDARELLDAALAAADCYGTFVVVCLPAPLPTQSFDVGNGQTLTIDTDNVDHCDTTALGTTIDACVRAGTAITIDGAIRATGSRPLILVATAGSITLNMNARIDVSSHRSDDSEPGAGGNHVGCAGAANANGAGGGHGGSYGGAGGNGGSGGLGNGGIASPAVDPPTTLQGGCPGGNGGNSNGSRGNGGGAFDLIAESQITINGKINASGGGGHGGDTDFAPKGGGGGGSGGLIVIDTETFTLNGSGTLLANGGGGGEGNAGFAGADGKDPNVLMPTTAAAGGTSAGNGGNGGLGATADAGGSGSSGGLSGGGGAGGGTGFVLSKAVNSTLNGMSSPSVRTMP